MSGNRRLPIRWLTLGEAVAVAAVIISALGLYNSWNNDKSPPVAAAPDKKALPLTLRATADAEGTRLTLAPLAEGQAIQSQTIAFPAALGVSPVETTGDPRIEAGWVENALRKAAEAEKAGAGDRRLPVLVTTNYIEDGDERTDSAVYQLGYAMTEGGFFGGRHVRLRGLSLSTRNAKDGQKRIDALWTAKHP